MGQVWSRMQARLGGAPARPQRAKFDRSQIGNPSNFQVRAD
jgi:hypothetical protein